MIDAERLTPRSFTGLTNEEWAQFSDVVKARVGLGKRSMFISTMVRRANENARWFFEKEADNGRFADHAVKDTYRFFGINMNN